MLLRDFEAVFELLGVFLKFCQYVGAFCIVSLLVTKRADVVLEGQ